ncbi:MAG: HNH endonuclease [Cyanobium sp. M30B3]|nr:MAG: HNH endonuclease [Cyanobium sp. M30B3]
MDHIVPSNQGGTGDLSNLQALCFRCNAGKRETGCVFYALEGSGRVLLENELRIRA